MGSILLYFLAIVVGACLVAVAIWLKDIARARSVEFAWWHWLLFVIWSFTWILAFAWLGSQLGEGSMEKGAWIGFGLLIFINLLIGISLVMWGIMRPQEKLEG